MCATYLRRSGQFFLTNRKGLKMCFMENSSRVTVTSKAVDITGMATRL